MKPTVFVGPIRWLQKMGREIEHRRLTRRGWYDLRARSDTSAVFIGGCPRSGTTLLREILARHSRVVGGIEAAPLVPVFEIRRIADRWQIDRRHLRRIVRRSQNVVEFTDELYRQVVEEEGKTRWVDKAPANVRVVSELLTWFPRGRFIHVIRDGRDVTCSLRNHPKQILRKGVVKQVSVNNPIEDCARTWVADVSFGLPFRGHPRYLEVRYEQLVSDPECEIHAVCAFIEECCEDLMIRPVERNGPSPLPGRFINNPNAGGPISTESVGRWRLEMTDEDRRRFVDHAGELLIALGYADNHDWVMESGPSG